MVSPPPQLERLRVRVDAALTGYLDAALPRLTELHPSLDPLAEELRSFILGAGKRVRPALLLTGYRAGGGDDIDDVLGPALALELLHTCALLHDDIIDAAPTRRGRTSAHVRFSREHRAAGWAGDSDLHGAAVAILLGDLAFVQADELFLSATVPADRLLTALSRFATMREEVMAGQYLDLYAAASRSMSRELAITVATTKSGRYSVARPLELGAVLAGADDEVVAGLVRVGEPLGRAFQIRDDVLGVFGSEQVTGKSIASDLREGKRTLLIAETAARLPDEDVAVLESLLGDPMLDQAGVQQIRALLRESGGLEATLAYVDDAVTSALDELDRLELAADAAGTLRAMAEYLRDRQA